MPGPVAHHFIADSVAQQLVRNRAVPPEVGGSPFLYFGSQGPDFLFFNIKDWPEVGGFSREIRFVLDIYGTLNEIKAQVVEALPLEEIDRAIEAARDESTAARQIIDLVRANQSVFALIEANVREGIAAFVAKNFGTFLFTEVIGHPEQKVNDRYQDKTKWWWFDTLHYKKTGQYAQTLLRNAQARGNAQEIAYALGYLTHYAADTVGHPYINILSGGPYRTHSQRHKVVENYHDTYVYSRFVPGGEFAQSRLYERYLLDGSLAFPRMPAHLSELIINTMRQVYPDRPTPRYGQLPEAGDLQASYHLWFEWFKMATTVLDGLKRPEPYRLDAELADALRRFEREISEIGELLSRPTRGGFSILAIFEFLAALALAFLQFFRALIDFVIGVGLTLALSPLRKLLSVAYEALYNLFMTFYEMVALAGLAFPFNSMLARPTIQHFFNPAAPIREDFFNHNAGEYGRRYPIKFFNPPGLDIEAHLVYPFLDGMIRDERTNTNMGPAEYLRNDPMFYINGWMPTNRDCFHFLQGMTSDRLAQLNSTVFSSNYSLGSALNFSLFAFNEVVIGKSIPDFNLDGDRGYGFKSWRLRESTRETPGTDDDFPHIRQIEQNPDHHVPDPLVQIL